MSEATKLDARWAEEQFAGLAERWQNTAVWHDPPFLDGTIHVSTADLLAADLVLSELAALRSQLAAATARVEAMEREREYLRRGVEATADERDASMDLYREEKARAEAERDRLRADLERERADFAHVNLAVEAAEAARDAAVDRLKEAGELVAQLEASEHDSDEQAERIVELAALLASLPTPGPATRRTITVRHYDLLGELNVEQVMGIPRDENLWAEIRVSRGHETGTLDVISEIRPESYREPTPGPAEPTGSPSGPVCGHYPTPASECDHRNSKIPHVCKYSLWHCGECGTAVMGPGSAVPISYPCPCPDCHPGEPVKP